MRAFVKAGGQESWPPALFRGAIPGVVAFLVIVRTQLAGGPWRASEPMLEPSPFIAWDASLILRSGLGYEDNPLLSPGIRSETAVLQLGADVFLSRLPVDDHAFTLFLSADDRRYLDQVSSGPGQPEANKEQLFLASADYRLTVGESWRPGLAVVSYYAEQVYDASDFGGQPGTVRARGKVLQATPSVRYTRGAWSLEAQAVAGWFWFADPISDYAEYGPRLIAGWRPGTNSVVELAWNWTGRPFDSRAQTDILGTPLSGTLLTTYDLRTQLEWRQTWDGRRRFQTSLRGFHLRRTENGDGFSDYDRLGLVGMATFRAGRWLVRGTGRWSTYDFAYQIVSPFNPVPRTREEDEVEARVEYRLTDRIRLYGEYLFERQRSNVPSDRYSAHAGLLGVEREF